MMAYKIRELGGMYGICDSYNSELVCWNDLLFDREAVKGFLSENAFPFDVKYCKNDFLFDLTTDAPVLIPSQNKQTAEYICRLFTDLS